MQTLFIACECTVNVQLSINMVALLQRAAKGWKLQDLATWGAKMGNTWEGKCFSGGIWSLRSARSRDEVCLTKLLIVQKMEKGKYNLVKYFKSCYYPPFPHFLHSIIPLPNFRKKLGILEDKSTINFPKVSKKVPGGVGLWNTVCHF